MKRAIGLVIVAIFVFSLGGSAGADGDKDSLAIVDKAIKALGGEEKLKSVKAATWKAKGSMKFGDNENQFTSQTTVQGLDKFRREFDGEFNGKKFKGITVVNGDKGQRRFGDNNMDLNEDAVANEKRNLYLQIVPIRLVPLKGKKFKVATAGEEKVGDAAAVAVKATGPDGKDFKLYFDKNTGLPLKLVATVAGFNGKEFTQETTYGNFKDFDGIKVATKIENKRNGEKFMDQEITEFKVLLKVDPKTFGEIE
jgi:hypothetical protein